VSAFLRPDDFLSRRLGKPALTLDLALAPDGLGAEGIRRELDRALGGREGFVQARAGVGAGGGPGEARLLEDLGFRLADTLVRFEGAPRLAAKPGSAVRSAVRPATPSDEAAVRALSAENLTSNRFFFDPLIPLEAARAIKADWAGNYFAGKRGDALFVADEGDRDGDGGGPQGFALLLRRPGALVVDLVAVAENARGMGLGKALLAAAMAGEAGEAGEPGGRHLSAGTSAANAAALAFYQALGLRAVEIGHYFHLHGAAA